jgi:hypothetical protein
MPWEVFVLGLAVLSIINMVLGFLVVFFDRNPDIEQVISFVDAVLSLAFLIDAIPRPTSRRRAMRCGIPSSRCRRWATATSIPSRRWDG